MRENWYRDVWLLGVTIIVVLSAIFGYTNNSDRIDDIQAERTRNTLAACKQTNREHAAIVGFVKRGVPRDRLKDPRVVAYLARAERTFPQVNCKARVAEQIKK